MAKTEMGWAGCCAKIWEQVQRLWSRIQFWLKEESLKAVFEPRPSTLGAVCLIIAEGEAGQEEDTDEELIFLDTYHLAVRCQAKTLGTSFSPQITTMNETLLSFPFY